MTTLSFEQSVIKWIVASSPLPTAPPVIPSPISYEGFVRQSLAPSITTPLYLQLGLESEMGEVRQVFCKHLRIGRHRDADLARLLDELGDCWYWVAALDTHCAAAADLCEPEITRVMSWVACLATQLRVSTVTLLDYLERVNYAKLIDRQQTTGSVVKD